MAPKDLLYTAILILIKTCKWTELQVLKLFSDRVTKNLRHLCEERGILFHVTGETPWTSEDEKRILAKCAKNFATVCHLKVNNPDFFVHFANTGPDALGEAYVSGDVDFYHSEQDIAEFAFRVQSTGFVEMYLHPWNRFLNWLQTTAFNMQTLGVKAKEGVEHYELGNDLFEACLDPWMQYTCGYWAAADNLNDAQINKMELIAKKLDLQPGMSVLDLGCGWGTLCKYLAENYGVQCVGVNLASEGLKYGREACKGLPVEFRNQDYREINEKFDRVVSVGMLEHVGRHNYREFFQVCNRCLKDDGIVLVHTIGLNHETMPLSNPWIQKYIFPNGSIPYYTHVAEAIEGLFILEDWHNFGQDYAKTLNSWRANFILNWPKISLTYGERFYRLWIFYLCSCEGFFQARRTHLWQLVLTKDGIKTEYRAAR